MSVKLTVLVPDPHVPRHNRKAVDAVLSFMEDNPVDRLVFLGDFLNFDSLSTHRRYEEQSDTIADCFRAGNMLLDEFERVIPSQASKDYFLGNHEDRLDTLLLNPGDRRVEAFKGLTSVDDGLRLTERGYQIIPYGDTLQLGKIYITHGWTAAVTHARQVAVKAGENIVYGHTHDVQVYTHHSLKNRPRMAASVGCLCDLDPRWMKGAPNKWVHGFGVLYHWGTQGMFSLYPVVIVNGKFVWAGKLYGA